MKISDKGIKMIAGFEGLSLKAYKADPSEKYYTIGYGHYGKDVKKDQTITKKQAIELLKKDISGSDSLVSLCNCVGKYNFTQNEYDALVSFCYNIGNVYQLTAGYKRDKKTIAAKMLLYNKCNGKELKGLTKRRKAENKLFLRGVYPNE